MSSIIILVPSMLPIPPVLVDCLWGNVDLFELFRIEKPEENEPSFHAASNNSEYEIH